MSSATVEAGISQGALVQVRGQKWVVGSIDPAPKATLVSLQSVEDGRYGETIEVIWEIEALAHSLIWDESGTPKKSRWTVYCI